jgi:alpha-glucosidase
VFFRTNGEQLGRDAARVPLPWSGEAAPYGFSDDDTAVTWLPQPAGWQALTAAAESVDPHSTLSQYRSMLRLRHELLSLADLDNAAVSELMPGVVRVTRGPEFACIVNCTSQQVRVPSNARVLVTSDESVMADGESLTLPPATGAWLSENY